ncbi:MAG: mechanosensitive ion channel [Opitutae bacterium]|nr:mechanosensitive ion channel [Opitutae bacterium]
MNLHFIRAQLDRALWTGTGFTLTFGDVFFALLLIFGGALASRLLATFFGKRLPRHLRQSHHAREFAPRWIFFSLWALFLLAALRVLGIPLTPLSFLGGAIALGFGFGAQNLCGNLISGVILLAARPYQVGDIVEVDGQAGTVLAIGLRATEILTYDGVNLVVPNSNLISNTIVNRTNYDRSLRGLVTISAAYDADTRLVDETLRAAAAAHPAVINAPGKAPWTIFDNFGASGLEFKLFFWVDTTRASVAATASDIRHAALAAFRANGIAIPYPQLVVHAPPAGSALE